MDAEDALDRICRIVGWGTNPDPDDAEDAVVEVIQVLNSYVRAESPRNTVAHFLPGNLPDDEGNYPPHTPWMKYGPDGSGPWVIRCGGPTLATCHQSFDGLTEWAGHCVRAT